MVQILVAGTTFLLTTSTCGRSFCMSRSSVTKHTYVKAERVLLLGAEYTRPFGLLFKLRALAEMYPTPCSGSNRMLVSSILMCRGLLGRDCLCRKLLQVHAATAYINHACSQIRSKSGTVYGSPLSIKTCNAERKTVPPGGLMFGVGGHKGPPQNANMDRIPGSRRCSYLLLHVLF